MISLSLVRTTCSSTSFPSPCPSHTRPPARSYRASRPCAFSAQSATKSESSHVRVTYKGKAKKNGHSTRARGIRYQIRLIIGSGSILAIPHCSLDLSLASNSHLQFIAHRNLLPSHPSIQPISGFASHDVHDDFLIVTALWSVCRGTALAPHCLHHPTS